MRIQPKDRKPVAPNFRTVPIPECCATCEHFKARGSDYDDSPEGCYEYQPPARRQVDFNTLCDGYERNVSAYPVNQ